MQESEYQAWSAFRYQIRVWIRRSEEAARDAGIPPQHHQLLLAVMGFPEDQPPLITDLAERLQLRHHTVVGLLDRMEERELVRRRPLGQGRGVTVEATPTGKRVLATISDALRPQFHTAGQALIAALSTLIEADRPRERTSHAPRLVVGDPPRSTRATRSSRSRVES